MAEEYECPAGTAWNHIEGRCDWLDNVDCTRAGKPKSDLIDDGQGEDTDGGGDEEIIETTRKIKKSKSKQRIETTTISSIFEEDMDTDNSDNKIGLIF